MDYDNGLYKLPLIALWLDCQTDENWTISLTLLQIEHLWPMNIKTYNKNV